MSAIDKATPTVEETPVTDIRRIRKRLSAECDNDVFRLGQRAREAAARLQAKLGLRPVTRDAEGPVATK